MRKSAPWAIGWTISWGSQRRSHGTGTWDADRHGMGSRKVVLGLVDNHEQAGNVVADLRLNGFPVGVMSVLFASDVQRPEGPNGPSSSAVGFFSNARSLKLPRVGKVTAGGALSDLLDGPTGDLVSCLGEAGVHAIEAKQFERDLRTGSILVGVHTDHPAVIELVKEVFARYGVTGVLAQEEVRPSFKPRPAPSAAPAPSAPAFSPAMAFAFAR